MIKYSENTVNRKKRMVGEIRAFMDRQNISGTQAAALFGVGYSTMMHWLRGTMTPRMTKFQMLREKIHEFDSKNPTVPKKEDVQKSLFSKEKQESGIILTIKGIDGTADISFERKISMDIAGQIIASLYQKQL